MSLEFTIKIPSLEEKLKFQNYIRLFLLYMQDIKGSPPEKIKFTKHFISFILNHYRVLRIKPPPLNLHKYGIYPIDLERIIYNDQQILVHERSFEIKPDYTGSSEYIEISPEIKELMKIYLENAAKRRGKSFKLFTSLGFDIFTGEQTHIDISLLQIENFIINRGKNPPNWIINPVTEKYYERETCSRSFGINYGFSANFTKTTENPVKKVVVEELVQILKGFIKDKKKIVERGELWRFRIHVGNRTNENKMINKNVVYVGRIAAVGEEIFFVDAYYTMKEEDFAVLIVDNNDFKEKLLKMHEEDRILLLIGCITGKIKGKIAVIPYGFLPLT